MKKFELIEILKEDPEMGDDTILCMAVEIFEYVMLKRWNGSCDGHLSGIFPRSNEPYIFASGDAARDFHHAMFIAEMEESGKEIKKI